MLLSSWLQPVRSTSRSNRGQRHRLRDATRRPHRRRLAVEPLEDRRLLSIVTWDGDADLDWNNPLNWDNDMLPGPGDDVLIGDSTPDITITHSSGTTSINNLTSAEALVISGGSFSIAATSAISSSLTLNTTLGGTGDLTVGGLLTLGRYSKLWGSGTTLANGGIAMSGVDLRNGTLENPGTATWDGTGDFHVADGCVFHNPGTFDIQGDGGGWYTHGTFDNEGLVSKSGGTGTSTLGMFFNNNGDIEVQTGILRFGGGITQSGGTSIVHLGADSGKFAVAGGLNPSGTLQVELAIGFTPTLGDTFIVFDNDGADAVGATYDGLPEGATYSVSGVVFQISYAGGTGNDIQLTVVAVDNTPPVIESVDVAMDLQSLIVRLNDDDLDAARATASGNYRLTAAGVDGLFDTADDHDVTINAVLYDAANDLITLQTLDPLFDDIFRLRIDGDDEADGTLGVTDLAGNFLQGGDYEAVLDLTSVTMIDDLVSQIEPLGLSRGAEASGLAQLEAVVRLLDMEVGSDMGVLALLDAFKRGVERWFDRAEISAEERDGLIADADLIMLGITLTH